MKALQVIAAAVLAAGAQIVSAEGDAKFYACYDNHGSLKNANLKSDFNSRGECRTRCVNDDRASGGKGFSVQAMTAGDECWCGNKLPNKSYKVDNDKCNFPCPGFPSETCGNRAGDYFSVYITGLEPEPEMDEIASSSSSSSSASKTTSSSTTSVPTVTVATSPTAAEVEATNSTSPKSSPVNKAAVAAGCVVGVLVIIGIGVGAFIFLRRRRRQQVEDEYRRSAAAREFGQKPASDHRLDPGMVQRRDSVGSIADNQDYSRRILKVTNPDG
ncbi:hypothetical protein EDC01DRAFT_140785 [Geopyxis carbonaria]|nr:hypothetical protein EDC01DRAFT_140785 [Geopyxis carbonaria]